MFGLFSKKPDAELRDMYWNQAGQATQICKYLSQNNACPPNDGEDEIDLLDKINRTNLMEEILLKIKGMNLADASDLERSTLTLKLSADNQNNSGKVTPIQSNAILIVFTINIIDMITRHYFSYYPKFKPMLNLVNHLEKISSSGLQVVFGDDMPIEVRRAFPHFSSLFEHHRANF
jgi:hypothetical protein